MMRKNNKGASLIFIIACIAVVTVVGMAILLVATQNREMALLEKKTKESFYEADEVSDELVIVLEALAQEAVAEAYTDFLLQYEVSEQEAATAGFSARALRLQRYYTYFAEALEKKIREAGSLQNLFAAAMGIADPEAMGIALSYEGIGTETETYEVEGCAVERKNLRLQKVELLFTSEDGYQTKISTDLLICPKDPEAGIALVSPGESIFGSYALLSKGDVRATMPSGQSIFTDGSIYCGGNLALTANHVYVTMQNATQVLIKKNLTVNKADLTVYNSETEAYTGLWAAGITVGDGGRLSTDVNCYVADDLEIRGNKTEVVMSGYDKEYVGYSGGVGDTADNSAVVINNASEIMLDFSGLGELCLTGNAYIKDEVWENTNPGDVSLSLGVLQGESVAYREMQGAYLVPGECLVTGYNPMRKAEFDAAGGTIDACVKSYVWKTKKNGTETAWDLSTYLDATKPVVTRYVKFDGGTTVFVYLYLNFASEKMAAEYFREYLKTERGEKIVEQMDSMDALGTNSRIRLAQTNYLVGNGIGYDDSGFHMEEPTNSSEGLAKLVNARVLAKQRRDSLFYGLSSQAVAGGADGSYDVVTDRVLQMEAVRAEPEGLQKKSISVNGIVYDLYLYNGEGSVCTITEDVYIQGIVLVNGKLNISATTFTVDGLVIATEGVEFTSGATLTANAEVVNAMLTANEVGQYFRGYGSGEEEASAGSDVVELIFEDWKKN